MNDLEILKEPWVLVVGGTFLAGILLGCLRWLLIHNFRKLTRKTRFTFDSMMAEVIGPPLTLLSVAALVVVFETLVNLSGLTTGTPIKYAALIANILLILAAITFVDRFVFRFVGTYSERSEALKNSRGLIQGISRGIVLTVGALVLLGTFGVSITPVVASLGITSLAVALALQPTLENLFSGVQLVVDKPIRVGDFIELDSGEQGFVDKIGWRSTWIRMLPNNVVIMPNSVLSNSKIINYYYPEKELSVPVEVGVHYDSDLEHVEKVTLDVAREILISHEWGVDDYNTFVVYHTFDNSSINFTVMLRAKEYFNRFWVRSAFIKALHKRYAKEGIVIPYPIRAINVDQEGSRSAIEPQRTTD